LPLLAATGVRISDQTSVDFEFCAGSYYNDSKAEHHYLPTGYFSIAPIHTCRTTIQWRNYSQIMAISA